MGSTVRGGPVLTSKRTGRPHRLLALGLAAALACGSLLAPSTGDTPVATSALAVEEVDTPVTIMGAGDIAEGGSRLVNATATGNLIRQGNPDFAVALGDNAYPCGTATDYSEKYEPTWGSFKAKTRPIPGNHEYECTGSLTGYDQYFGAANVTNSIDGGVYYAWDVGNGWRAYAVNTEIDTSGAQLTWLKNDVAAHPGMHYLLYTHHPRYTSGEIHPGIDDVCPLWNALASTGSLEAVLFGHQHNYERFTRMDCAGQQTAAGTRSFVVGSGGNELYGFKTPVTGSQFRNATDYGVIKLVLHRSSYDWSFVASGRGWNGSTSIDTNNVGAVLDSGTEATHGAASAGNTAPVVDAGPARTITLPDTASLDGTVTDDGLPTPPGAVTTTWSKYDGPGTVTFANASAVDTTAAFSTPGTYHLMLRASDSDATTTDMVTVTVRPPLAGNVIDVPAEQPTVQAAVQAASSGDTILLAPGTYQGGVWVQGKSLTIASRYLTTDDPAFTGQTVVNGVIANACGGASGCAGDAVIEFGSQAGGSKVIGLTVSGGADGVRSSARVDVTHSRLTGNVDGIDYGNDSSGTLSDDLFDHNTDDGLDLNGRVALAVRNSTIEANEGDGVEFRMYPYVGPNLEVSFVGNRFLGNDTDGIQLIDSDGASSRVVRIERNVFHGNGAASIGCLPNEQTNEDFSGAPLAERVYVTNNTFSGDRYGVVGGANSIVLNNIFTGITASALRRVGGSSSSAHNLFWSNGTNFEESVVDQPRSLFANPLLNTDYTLPPGSPAIDAGTASYQWNGETVLNMSSASYAGSAPDLGAFESGSSGGNTNQVPVVNAGIDQSITLPEGATLDATVTDDGQPTANLTTTWTQTSGPGTTTFANPNAVDTTATFSTAGTYTLLLTANDTDLTGSDTVQITVASPPPPGSGTIDQRITLGSDDAEESATGSYSGSSTDLELVNDRNNQLVGLRFPNLAIPKGSTITRAYVQFETDEKQSEATALTINGQAADNPATYSSANKISTRTRTNTAATWNPAAWTTIGEAGTNQRTTDLAGVIQEIVNRTGWAPGNALALIITGTGHRTARAFEGRALGAPLLHIEYSAGG
jgi:hypothetical protein